MKNIFMLLGLLLAAVPLHALTVEVESIEVGKTYSAIKDTATVRYVDRCTRGKFEAYEWKTWEGYYSARAFIQPIANITVKRDPNEIFGGDTTPFIKKALEETAKAGGNIFCLVQLKKNKQLLEPERIVFRAYKQLFQAGNASWETFFNDISNQGILLTLQDLQLGEKTRDALEKVNAAQKPKQ